MRETLYFGRKTRETAIRVYPIASRLRVLSFQFASRQTSSKRSDCRPGTLGWSTQAATSLRLRCGDRPRRVERDATQWTQWTQWTKMTKMTKWTNHASSRRGNRLKRRWRSSDDWCSTTPLSEQKTSRRPIVKKNKIVNFLAAHMSPRCLSDQFQTECPDRARIRIWIKPSGLANQGADSLKLATANILRDLGVIGHQLPTQLA